MLGVAASSAWGNDKAELTAIHPNGRKLLLPVLFLDGKEVL